MVLRKQTVKNEAYKTSNYVILTNAKHFISIVLTKVFN